MSDLLSNAELKQLESYEREKGPLAGLLPVQFQAERQIPSVSGTICKTGVSMEVDGHLFTLTVNSRDIALIVDGALVQTWDRGPERYD